MSQMNPKTFLHNTTFSVQLPYIATLPVTPFQLMCLVVKYLGILFPAIILIKGLRFYRLHYSTFICIPTPFKKQKGVAQKNI